MQKKTMQKKNQKKRKKYILLSVLCEFEENKQTNKKNKTVNVLASQCLFKNRERVS